jgi:hypothetical protein
MLTNAKIALISLLLIVTIAEAKPASSTTVMVKVTNACHKSLEFRLESNMSKNLNGTYRLQTPNTTDLEGHFLNIRSFFLNSGDDEEIFTISHQQAVCQVDYAKIKSNWYLTATISDCDATPKCLLN